MYFLVGYRVFWQALETCVSPTMTAADRLWSLLKDTSACKWTHLADGPHRHHYQKVQKDPKSVKIDPISVRTVLTSSETKKTGRSCCDCLALQNNSECFAQLMTSCQKWFKFQNNANLQVCLWDFPCFPFCILKRQQVLHTNINKHQLYTSKTGTQPCLGCHPCRTMLERFRWSKKLDSLLDSCTLYPFCVSFLFWSWVWMEIWMELPCFFGETVFQLE